MGLIDQLVQDMQTILTGDASVDITFISDTGREAIVKGFHVKHHLGVNPETGAAISSKKASVTISENALMAVDPDYPLRDANGEVNLKNHRIRVKDSTAILKKYKAEQWFPDETAGVITIILSVCAD